MQPKLIYVGIRVSDLRRSLRFYTKVFRLKEVGREDVRKNGLQIAADGGIYVRLMDPRSKVQLELNWYPPGSRYGKKYVTGEGLDHIAFSLGRVSAREMDREYERLLRAGARPTEVTTAKTAGWMCCVKDPDGNWVELLRAPTAAERRTFRTRERRRRRRDSPSPSTSPTPSLN